VKLSERLEALLALCECTDDAERDHNAPDSLCVFVDVRPAEFDALLREAAELARSVEDAPQGRVDMRCAADAVIVDELPERAVLALYKQRVRIVFEDGKEVRG
jgi:hypothetical protein